MLKYFVIVNLLLLLSCGLFSPATSHKEVESKKPIMDFIDRFLATNEASIYNFLKNDKVIDCSNLIRRIDNQMKRYDNERYTKLYSLKIDHRIHKIMKYKYAATYQFIVVDTSGYEETTYEVVFNESKPWYNFWSHKKRRKYIFTVDNNGKYSFHGFKAAPI